jgi:alpha-glucosidase
MHIAIHEAALVDYSAMWLRRVSGQRLKAVLSPSSSGPKVTRKAPFVTPWRTLQIADSAPGLYMSDLILNLNEPNKLGDVSWVKPFKYVGIWWGMHLVTKTWASGPKHGATTAETRRYIDFAAKHGFRGRAGGKDGIRVGMATGLRTVRTSASPSRIRFRSSGTRGVRKEEGRAPPSATMRTSGNIAPLRKAVSAALDLYAKLGIDAGQDRLRAGRRAVCQALGGRTDVSISNGTTGQVQSRHHRARGRRGGAAVTLRVNAHELSRTRVCGAPIPTGSRAKARAAWNTTPGAIRRIHPSTSEPGIHAHARGSHGFHAGV